MKKFLAGVALLLGVVMGPPLASAQLATSCTPGSDKAWCITGTTATLVDGLTGADFGSSGTLELGAGSAALPSLFWNGDTNTGFYWIASDRIGVSSNGAAQWEWKTTELRAANSNGWLLINETASATNPTVIGNRTDPDTGLGWTSADKGALVAGGITVAEFTTDASTTQFLHGTGTALLPSISFIGRPNLGFYESGAVLYTSIAGSASWAFSGTTLLAVNASGPSLLNTGASSTVPTIIPLRTDSDSGMGSNGADDPCIIAGAVTAMCFTETAGVVAITVDPYTREIMIPPGHASQGVTAPTETTIGNSRALTFDATAELVFFHIEIPSDWDAASDMTLEVHWTNEPGTAIADTETVKWDAAWYSRAVGEAVDGGTEATGTTTYTQSGAGTDKELIESAITIPYSTGNQPLAAGDHLSIKFNRDFADTYGSDANVIHWELEYTSNAIPTG